MDILVFAEAGNTAHDTAAKAFALKQQCRSIESIRIVHNDRVFEVKLLLTEVGKFNYVKSEDK